MLRRMSWDLPVHLRNDPHYHRRVIIARSNFYQTGCVPIQKLKDP
jgi:hypothetical protein